MRNMNFVFEKIHALKLLRNIILRESRLWQCMCSWVFVTPMDSWMCQQPSWTTTKNLCQTIYTPPKTTLSNNFQTMNNLTLPCSKRKRKKMANNKRSSNGLGWPFVVPPPAFILEQLKLCGDSFENSHWSNVAGQGLWLVDPGWAPPNVGPM